MLEEYYGNSGDVGMSVSEVERHLGELRYRGFNWTDLSPSTLR
jgi:hypothetical protein